MLPLLTIRLFVVLFFLAIIANTHSSMAATLKNAVLEAWAKGKPATNAWLLINSPVVAEGVASLAFDSVTIDLQHGTSTGADVVSLFQAISGQGSTPFVRVQSNDLGQINQVLDAGARGVICPLINNRQECEDFVKACLYPPLGLRSFGPVRAQFTDPDYFAKANRGVVKLAMIETKKGLDNLEEILDVEHLDGVFIGPNDLAIGLGIAPQNDPSDPIVVEAIEHIRQIAASKSKKAGIFCGSGSIAKRMMDQGFDLVCPGADLSHLLKKFQEQLDDLDT